jgi:hypothetical protein
MGDGDNPRFRGSELKECRFNLPRAGIIKLPDPGIVMMVGLFQITLHISLADFDLYFSPDMGVHGN